MKRPLSALPEWPSLVISEENRWCHVHGEHDTHVRLQIAEVIRIMLIIACFVGWVFWLESATGIGFALLAMATVFLFYDKSALLICMALFPKETNVVFEHDTITINGKSYAIESHMDAQFRAGEKFLNERQEQRVRNAGKRNQLSAMGLHKVGYRKIEMIYGGNVVLIAVISNPQKAANFVFALQQAWEKSRMFHPEEAQKAPSSRVE